MTTLAVPMYFIHALTQLRIRETPGPQDTAEIVRYWQQGQLSDYKPSGDETPWCAAFVCAMLELGGIQSTRKPNAKAYQTYGADAVGQGLFGAIVVMDRAPVKGQPAPAWQGHVGFCCGFQADKVHVLGGNQGNSVSIAAFPMRRIKAVKYPLGLPAVLTGTVLQPTQAIEPTTS